MDVKFGSLLASKTTPGRALTRKGRPSILNDSTMKIKFFDPVAVAGGSRGRPLKPNSFYKGIGASKCLQNNPKWSPKASKTASKNYAEIVSKKCAETCLQMLQNCTQNGAPGGPKSCPGAPEGTPRAPGRPWELPWTPRDLILAAPEVPGTPFWYNFGRL